MMSDLAAPLVIALYYALFVEINKVRVTLFNLEKKPLTLPDEDGGPKVSLTEKLYVPVKEHPDVSCTIRRIICLMLVEKGYTINCRCPQKVHQN